MTAEEFVVVRGLKKAYPVRGGLFRKAAAVTALDGVDFSIAKGETLGLVGESGCGKSTLGRLLLRLEEPDGGSIRIEGTDIFALKASELQKLRRNVQIIFQDPYSSLNPRKRVDSIVGEPLAIHGIADGKERDERVIRLLETVGLRPEQRFLYPHQFSGGQRQRIGVARAIAMGPRFVVADEPVSSLDVSIQAQVLNLLEELQEEYHLTYLFISHDLSVVRHISDRVAVMYLGQIVEQGPTDALYESPLHPYTQALLAAIPRVERVQRRERILLTGGVPSPIDPPSGCRFHPRCFAKVGRICEEEQPPFFTIGSQQVACWIHRAHST